jgi:cytochrome c peroxidase
MKPHSPVNGHIEMGESFEGVINKIKDDKDYQEMFKEVFRYPFIRPEFILKALEQFTGLYVSGDSKFDRYKKGIVSFSVQEGKWLPVIQSQLRYLPSRTDVYRLQYP